MKQKSNYIFSRNMLAFWYRKIPCENETGKIKKATIENQPQENFQEFPGSSMDSPMLKMAPLFPFRSPSVNLNKIYRSIQRRFVQNVQHFDLLKVVGKK